MFRKMCFRSVFYAINRYNNLLQTSQSSVRFLSHIQSDDKLIDTNEFSRKYQNNSDEREKRLKELKESLPDHVFDTLSEDLIKADTTDELIQLIGKNHKKLNTRNIVEALESLHSLTESVEQRAQAFETKQFQTLIDKALIRISKFNGSEVLNCYQPLIDMGVGEQSRLVRSLVQRGREVCDDFTAQQIVEFDCLIKKMASNDQQNFSDFKRQTSESIYPLSTALKQSLASVLKRRIDSKQVDLNDTNLLIECLRIALEHSLIDAINPLLEAFPPKISDLTAEQLISIVNSLVSIKFFRRTVNLDAVDSVIQKCLDKLCATSVNDVSTNDYSALISIISNTCDKRLYYRKELFDLMAECVVNNPEKFNNSSLDVILKSFNENDHIHYGLMDYISKQIVDDTTFLSHHQISVITILRAFALPSGYATNQPNSDLVYDTVVNCSQVKRFSHSEKSLMFRILNYLCVIGYYPEDFIRNCFLHHFEKALEFSDKRRKRDEFLKLLVPVYQALCLVMSDATEDNKKLIKKLRPFIREITAYNYNGNKGRLKAPLLHRTVLEVCGGTRFVANNIYTEFGHCCAQLIAMNTDGSFIPLDFDRESSYLISELNLPNDCIVMAIIGLTYSDYCRHPMILKASVDYKIRTLKKSAIIPVVVNIDGFHSLPESERKVFLIEKIRESNT